MIDDCSRISPLILAIVMKAPVRVIEALLSAYPNGIKTRDDKKMLPLHFAFRLGCSEEVANILVDSYPKALRVKDSKGHTPRGILKAYRHHYKKERAKGDMNQSMRKKAKGTTNIDRNRKILINTYL